MKLLEPYTDGGRFDVVVIGSGFGGSVSACRFAEADKSVLVLERGRPYPPGSFPRSPKDMRAAFWDPSRHLYGMFNVWHFQDIEAVVSSGLGGGSLIYANVLLRKDEHWFTQDIPGGTGQEQWGVTRSRPRSLLRLRRAHAPGPDPAVRGERLPAAQDRGASRRRRPARQGLEPRARSRCGSTTTTGRRSAASS